MKTTQIKLFLHSDARINTSTTDTSVCTFSIPDISFMSGTNVSSIKKITLHTERFHAQSELRLTDTDTNTDLIADGHQTAVLICDQYSQPYTYDTITKTESRVIASQGNPLSLQGSFNMSYDVQAPVDISTSAVTNREITVKLAYVASTNTKNAYYQLWNRAWCAVLVFTIHHTHC